MIDWTIFLKTQQLDFISRIKSNYLLISDDKNQFTELINCQNKLLESVIKSCHQIIKQYELISDDEKLFNNLFQNQLGKFIFKYYFSDLINEIIFNDDFAEQKVDFTLKKNAEFCLKIKTSNNIINDLKWWFSSDEIKQNNLLVCYFSPQIFKSNYVEYPVILAGFLPTNLIENKEQSQYFALHQLLYSGGLKTYLNSFNTTNFNPISITKNSNINSDYSLAIAINSKTLKVISNDYKNYVLKGISKWETGDQQGAIQNFSEAIKINSDYYLGYYWRGFINSSIGYYEEALDDYNKALKINSKSFYAFYKRGFVFSKMNNYLSALEDYSTAIIINNNLFQAFYNRGICKNTLKDKLGAIEDYNQALKLNSNFACAFYNRGIIYSELGDFKQAIFDYQEAIKIQPNYTNAYYNLAILLADLGDYKSAINIYNKVLEMKPNFIPAEYNKRVLIHYFKRSENLQNNNDNQIKAHNKFNISNDLKLSKKDNNEEEIMQDLFNDNLPKLLTNPWGSILNRE